MSCIFSTRAELQSPVAASIATRLDADGPLPPELPSSPQDYLAASLPEPKGGFFFPLCNSH